MKIYVRYTFFQTLKIFFLALSATTLGLIFYSVVVMSIKNGVPIGLPLKMTPYLLPEIFSKTLPIASLASVTFFFSRMAGNNEIIAIKALGIAPWRVLVPIWIFMFCVSLSSVWFNDLSVSWSRRQMTKVLLDGFESTILEKLRTDKRFATQNGKYVVYASSVSEDGRLIDPSFRGKGGEIIGSAETARLEVDSENAIVWIRLLNTNFEGSGGRVTFPTTYNIPFPLGEIFKHGYRVDPSAAQINEAIAQLDVKKEQNRRRLASAAAFAFLRGNVDETARPEWKNRAGFENGIQWQLNRYRLTVPRVWASGFACFFFAWVGAPFAIWFNKADYTATFFLCFFPVALLYYPLFMFGLEGAKSGLVSPMFTWLGNVALGFVGFWFLKKIH